MDENFKKIIKEYYIEEKKKLIFDNGLIKGGKGHSIGVCGLNVTHAAPATAEYYAASIILGEMSENKGIELLNAIEELQVQNESDVNYGGFRWYREENEITDSNAAFFTMVPIATAYLICGNNIYQSHKEIIMRMMKRGLEWFSKECSKPKLFYPNKIVSDGSLYLALSTIMSAPEHINKANIFFERWIDYTDRRGWGWGENTSSCYGAVITNAFQLALKSWNGTKPELEKRIREKRDHLFELYRFHGGMEYVPSIRIYDFNGMVENNTYLNFFLGIRYFKNETLSSIMRFILNLTLYNEFLPKGEVEFSDEPFKLCDEYDNSENIKIESIFDRTFSYSWKGNNIRLGSINKFPVMQGTCHNQVWGLAWQTMPVSFIMGKEQLSFLQFKVFDGKTDHAHPADSDFLSANHNTALFKEDYLPEPETHCTQDANILIVRRNIRNLANTATKIEDRWVIPRFNGKIHRIDTEIIFRDDLKNNTNQDTVVEKIKGKWVVLEGKNSSIAILPMSYIDCSDTMIKNSDIDIYHENDNLFLSRYLYKGDKKYIRNYLIDNNWVVIAFDEKINIDQIKEHLKEYKIYDLRYQDYEVSRDNVFLKHAIKVVTPDGRIIVQDYDPFIS